MSSHVSCLGLTGPHTPRRVIGFRNWRDRPFSEKYLNIGGAKGQFLGFWAVIMQASFSFFGSEVPGIVRCIHVSRRCLYLTSMDRLQGKSSTPHG